MKAEPHPRSQLTYRHIFLLATAALVGISSGIARAAEIAYTQEFRLQDCTFSDRGQNPFFIIDPGYHQTFMDEEGGMLEVTVLNETRMIAIPINGVSTTVKARVVEERESENGLLTEISRNYYARCKQTNSIFYFGEDVDIYNADGTQVVSHEGAWLAGQPVGENGDVAMPGLIMPGIFLVGSRYFQELAAPVAMDRSEHIAEGVTVTTPAGTFSGCVQTLDTNPLETPTKKGDNKIYCPGIGLTVDETLQLVSF